MLCVPTLLVAYCFRYQSNNEMILYYAQVLNLTSRSLRERGRDLLAIITLASRLIKL